MFSVVLVVQFEGYMEAGEEEKREKSVQAKMESGTGGRSSQNLVHERVTTASAGIVESCKKQKEKKMEEVYVCM